jgi:uncharacterized protein (TIGR02231 family)
MARYRYRYPTLICLTLLMLGARAVAAKAPITSVVVYSDRAQVTRTQSVECKTKEALFAGLPSTLQPRSLWATLSGGPGEVVGLTREEEATGPRPEAKALQDQIRQIDDKIVALRDEVSAAAATTKKLESFRAHTRQIWGLQAAGKALPTGSWDQALDLLQRRSLAARRRQREAERKQRLLQRQRNQLKAELDLIRKKRRRTTIKVRALLRCRTGKRTVHLSYVVPGATWRMAYDLRLEPQKTTSSDKVTLIAKAVVSQGTGEDWSDVSLAVSTANLQRKNTPPKIARLRVSTSEPTETRKVLTRRLEHRRHLKVKTKAGEAINGKDSGLAAGLPAARRPPPEQALALSLNAARRLSVPSDGREVVATLRKRVVRATLSLESVPKLFPFVFRKASLTNPFDFPMLAGPVSLFSGRTYLGQTDGKLRAPGEPLAFSLGVDNQLQVHRYVKKQKLEGPGTFGSKKKLRHRYLIQVGNWTSRPQTVRVLENVPVSQVRDVQVRLSGDTTKPKSFDKTDGVLAWEVRLSPRSKRQLILDYTVVLPKSWEVRGY